MHTDLKCPKLSTPSNGKILLCDSGKAGVGYAGDNCSFTCNTGYKLTSNGIRTCQTNGTWSGTEITCRRGEINYIYITICSYVVVNYYILRRLLVM